MTAAALGEAPEMDLKLLEFIVEGLAYAMRPIKEATYDVTARYGLLSRGTAIMSLIALGYRYPSDLSRALKIRHSLITAELGHLTSAGLVKAEPSPDDRRKSKLSLTNLGAREHDKVKAETARLVTRNLTGYSRSELELFGQMLRDVSYTENEDGVLRLTVKRQGLEPN